MDKKSASHLSLLLVLLMVLAATVAAAQSPGPNVNMVSGTQWPGGDPFLQRQNEPACAVSTRNPMHLLCGSNDYRTVDIPGLPDEKELADAWLGVYKSVTAGSTWQSTLLPGYPQDMSPERFAEPHWGFQAGADPVVRAGHNGLFYYSFIAFDRGENMPGVVGVARFIDNNNKGGATFKIDSGTDPIAYIDTEITDWGNASHFADKPWLATDIPRAGALTTTISGLQQKQWIACPVDDGGGVGEAALLPSESDQPCDGQTLGYYVTEEIPPQTFACGNVYQAYSVFIGGDNNIRSKVMFTRSLDCGDTFSQPIKVSEGYPRNNGTTVVVDPSDGDVYVAWRQFASNKDPDQILFVRSADGGQTFTKAETVSLVHPFQQASTYSSFRTAMFPTMAVDGDGRVYIAWAEKLSDTSGRTFGRIVMTMSTDDGITWSTPVEVANGTSEYPHGNEFMPSLTFNQGRLMLLYYGQSFDHTVATLECLSGACPDGVQDFEQGRKYVGNLEAGIESPEPVVFNECIADLSISSSDCAQYFSTYELVRRHTIDVFVAEGMPGDDPKAIFQPPVQVSKYAFGSKDGSTIEQIYFNPPNYPMFATRSPVPKAFIGDYLDIVGDRVFVPDGNGGWAFNSEASASAVFHAVWTDNRDVRPPLDGDWSNYTPPCFGDDCAARSSIFDRSQTVEACTDEDVEGYSYSNAGMRNQNIYTSRITDGLLVGSLQNTKPLGETNITGTTIPLQRTFVVFVQNAFQATEYDLGIRHYRLELMPDEDFDPYVGNDPHSDRVSFTQFGPEVRVIDVSIPPLSTVSRMVYVTNADVRDASVRVVVSQLDGDPLEPSGPPEIDPNGLSDTVVLNPDITAPDITAPDITAPDITAPDITAPDITAEEVYNPDITAWNPLNPDITAPDITAPDITAPDITAPDITAPDITAPDITAPDITAPDITAPDITAPDITAPDITAPDITAPDITATAMGNAKEMKDFTWVVTNKGNTDANYDVNMLLNGSVPKGMIVQLILHKTYRTPTVNGCDLNQLPKRVLVSNIAYPEFVTSPADLGLVDPLNPSIGNGVLPLAPGETGNITLRVLVDQSASLTAEEFVIDQAGIIPAVVPEAVGTLAAAKGQTDPLYLTTEKPDLIIDSFTLTPSNPTPFDVITFEAVVANVGGSPAGPSTVAIDVGGERPGQEGTLFPIGPIAPGQSITVTRELTLIPQGYTASAIADFENDVLESDEENNLDEVVFYVVADGVITLDGVGDYRDDNRIEIDPDLEFVEASRTASDVTLRVRFASGTFTSATNATINIDTDEDASTGSPGSDAGCSNDNGVIGTDFLVKVDDPASGVASLSQYSGDNSTCGPWTVVTSGPLVDNSPVDGFDISIPVADIGGDDGRFGFKITVSADIPGSSGNAGVQDYLTNVGDAPALTY